MKTDVKPGSSLVIGRLIHPHNFPSISIELAVGVVDLNTQAVVLQLLKIPFVDGIHHTGPGHSLHFRLQINPSFQNEEALVGDLRLWIVKLFPGYPVY
jgi:hypothetical protein